MSSREIILSKIKQALQQPVQEPFADINTNGNVYQEHVDDETVVFAESFSGLGGKFVYCESEAALKKQLAAVLQQENLSRVYCADEKFSSLLQEISVDPYDDLGSCDCSVTGCEYLVARTGSMVLSAAQAEGRTASVYAPVHICIAYNHQLLFEVRDALNFLKEKYKNNFPSFISFATGPSRTADIEKTLVTGVHGPKEVWCFLVEG